MRDIFNAIQKSAIRIKEAIDVKDIGYSQQENSSGETQLQLDIQCDMIIEEEFSNVTSVHTIASEEKEHAQLMHNEGKYFIAYDPLDGSSLVDVNLSVGSIFGIYEGDFGSQNMVAACYVVYGPRVEMVFAENKTKLYLLQAGAFEFVKEIRLKEKGNLNAPGGTQQHWAPYHKELVDSFFAEGYRLRYSGGMVPDLHQILLKGGGLFSYPGTLDKPNGKLRKLFEVFPFAFIYEKSGGRAIDGKGDLMKLPHANIHDTAICFFGSNYEIERVKEVYAQQG
ncbi:MAG: class 1 fructose-bisphosphatase [Epsilonproteobacteria bacterium]|nr:class 1 fructose-bisphosphatase [Campylobacterota bacterium]OIO15667.1 MAG: fructose-bisphosphatase [Helicobacteraceae bacterium CG1_02_36_14]PIP11391.1 MAG: class 1 fructose-bisphosphatase [Sulfurimonas sp. CG23_combo_of_CG06-09_8_20_14_all_36_33]PIS23793.1 MAG: class 1 fructose-bisphosphatase [Sulfurimonas sp. CG08_land_8_20_14_0_20_36_33]PIU34769.1 MAG: class 1 fructose-bisphosphatase [Sulfurimonas sp. CG07_land_8_20_14_0_80_36_56]PIV05816.1 MAG: class 1 fructose-bisphosphatase [Sulfurim